MANNVIPRLYGNVPPEMARLQDNVQSVVGPVATALQNTPIMGAKPPAWIRMQLATGWAISAPPNPQPAYHKDALGYVHLKGVIRNVTGGPSSAVFATMPLGYRTLEILSFTVPLALATAQSILLNLDGTLQPDANIPNNAYFYLDCSYLAEA